MGQNVLIAALPEVVSLIEGKRGKQSLNWGPLKVSRKIFLAKLVETNAAESSPRGGDGAEAGRRSTGGRPEKKSSAYTEIIVLLSHFIQKVCKKEVRWIFWQTRNSTKTPPCDIMSNNCGKSNAVYSHIQGKAPDVANPVNHGALEFFERPSVWLSYDGSYNQELFPSWLPWPLTKFCRGIYPSSFCQQHALQPFFTCWSFP